MKMIQIFSVFLYIYEYNKINSTFVSMQKKKDFDENRQTMQSCIMTGNVYCFATQN